MGSTDKNADGTSAVENAVETEEDYCYCPKPGCLFEGGPTAAVVEHLSDAHARPIYDDVRYGHPWNFTLQLSWPWDVVFGVGEDERSAFFVLLQEDAPGGGGGGAPNMSVSLHVCAREDADCVGPQPLYRCKMTLESLSGDNKNKYRITTEPAVCDRVHLEVPQEMMLSGAETLAVSVQIEQLLPPADTHGYNASVSVHRPKRTRRGPDRFASSSDWV